MRLFIGINLPDDIKQEAWNFLAPLQISPKGWEHPHDYHQTLLFIGETPIDQLSLIKQRMDQFRFPAFNLKLAGPLFFPRRVMYLTFEPSPALEQLRQSINQAFPDYLQPHQKPFIPHVTVKRWQRYEYDHLHQGISTRAFPALQFCVTKLSLFKAEKDTANRKYHVLYEVNLWG